MEFADGEGESGRVLYVLLADLLGLIDGELHGLTGLADVVASRVFDGTDDVKRGLVFIAAFDEGDLRTGHDDGNGHVVVGVVGAEVERVHVYGNVGRGQVTGELILELAFAILPGGVLIVGGGVV